MSASGDVEAREDGRGVSLAHRDWADGVAGESKHSRGLRTLTGDVPHRDLPGRDPGCSTSSKEVVEVTADVYSPNRQVAQTELDTGRFGQMGG
jgi:hypothetical protein